MPSNLRSRCALARRGFTLVELIACIAVFVIVAAVVLPNLQIARISSRRAECLNNIRNLGLAAQMYATTQKGQLPLLIDTGAPINWGTTDAPLNGAAPWTVKLMPYIERVPLAERLLSSSNSAELEVDFRIDNLAAVKVKVFNCSEDFNDDLPGNLSYAINAGYIGGDLFGEDVIYSYDPATFRGVKPTRRHATVNYDYQLNGGGHTDLDAEIARSTGVAWADAPVTIDEISLADGSTTTLLFAENLQSQRWAGRAPRIDPTSTPTIEYEISDFSFGLPVRLEGNAVPHVVSDRTSHPVDGVGDPGSDPSASKSLALDANFRGAMIGTPRDGLINRNANSALEGEMPRPSSPHKGGVNVIFVGGNGKFLSETIDPTLYARLLTWDGEAKGQGKVTPTSF